MDQNMYSAPQSDVIGEVKRELSLASRWSRLWASLLDSIIMMLIIMPAMFFTGGFGVFSGEAPPSFGYNLIFGIAGIAIFLLINGSMLSKNGQTVGKKLLGIKIVGLNGELATWKDHLVKRYATYFLPGQVPIIGQLFSIVNILFIFGEQKRCVHDLAAGTKVVDA